MNVLSSRITRVVLSAFLFAITIGDVGRVGQGFSAPLPPPARLRGHVPDRAIAASQLRGRLPLDTNMSLTIALPLRNTVELQILLGRIYDPDDPLYGQYLSTQEFTDRFGPTQDDYDAVAIYAESLGFTVTGTHANRLALNLSGPVAAVEGGFHLRMNRYLTGGGREFFAPDNDPEVPDFIAARIAGIVGLDNAAVWQASSTFVPAGKMTPISPEQIGSGPGGGLTPRDIVTAYNLGAVTADGTGQVLGLFELDGYNPADVSSYVAYYGLPSVPLQNVLVDGFSGKPGTGASEVTLDIELQIALAPGASRILVYEGPNTSTGVVDTYNRIATDNLARQVSTSWGLSEGQVSSAILNAENSIFQQMAAQGQSIFAAAGDSGAYDNGAALSVDDPASQPYMVGVGGTQLFVNSGQTYNRETTWNVNGTISGGAGGGGVSSVWSIPSWQQGVVGSASLGSTVRRNVPDVSLNSDQYTGYSIYYKGGWYIFGGTSCASPLWAAFTARVNQQRSAGGIGPLGFANPALYQIAKSSKYAFDFHDIADNSTNLYYPAVPGFDDATGWGSFNGANLFADLTGSANPPAAPANLAAVPGNSSVILGWSPASGAATYNVYRGTAPGAEGATPVAGGITATSYTDTGLTNGITYYYKVAAVNSAGISGLSNEASATPAAVTLTITGGPAANPGKTSATITWTTNLSSDSMVLYGLSGGLSQSVSNGSLVTSHSLTLNGLARRTTYYFQAYSTAGGATVSSGILSFRTK